jgi:hypothetical protein
MIDLYYVVGTQNCVLMLFIWCFTPILCLLLELKNNIIKISYEDYHFVNQFGCKLLYTICIWSIFVFGPLFIISVWKRHNHMQNNRIIWIVYINLEKGTVPSWIHYLIASSRIVLLEMEKDGKQVQTKFHTNLSLWTTLIDWLTYSLTLKVLTSLLFIWNIIYSLLSTILL